MTPEQQAEKLEKILSGKEEKGEALPGLQVTRPHWRGGHDVKIDIRVHPSCVEVDDDIFIPWEWILGVIASANIDSQAATQHHE